MDLKEVWKTLDKDKLSKPVAGTVGIPKQSRHPVNKLIQAFTAGLVFCVVFELMFVYLLVTMDQTIVKLGLAVVVFLYAFLFAVNYKVLRRLRHLHHSDDPVVHVLDSVQQIVRATIRFQHRLSWAFFPMCVAAGFLMGISVKKDAAEMIVQPFFYVTLLATMAIVTPACFYLTRWMSKVAYGKYLDQIDGLIRQSKES